MLTLKHLGWIENMYPSQMAETLRAIEDAINQHGTIAGIDPTGSFPAPTAPTSLAVTQVAGGFDVAISDSDPRRGLSYFVEFSATAGFEAPRTVPLGPTRNVYLPFGAATYYFRCYAQYMGSDRSPYTVLGGTTPQSVTGGAPGTPNLGATQGTGAPSPAGGSPNPPVGGGFGGLGRTPPPRNFPGGRVPVR